MYIVFTDGRRECNLFLFDDDTKQGRAVGCEEDAEPEKECSRLIKHAAQRGEVRLVIRDKYFFLNGEKLVNGGVRWE